MARTSPALLSLLLAPFGCGGPSPKLPANLMAFVRSADGSYKSQAVKLNTLTDVVAIKGDVATLIGGARIVIDENDPQLQQSGVLTDAQYAQVLVKSEGALPRASYVEKAGVLWPIDFHTWNMVSAYYNLEKAFEYFRDTGAAPVDALSGKNASRVYYFPAMVFQQQSTDPVTDNAFWYSPLLAFTLLPFKDAQRLPLAMNAGVMAHEYAHRVFHLGVFEGAAIPAPFLRWQGTSTPQLNLLKALDEGLADYHAFGASCVTLGGCDTHFLAASFPPSDPAIAARDLAGEHCMTAALRNALDSQNINDFMAKGLEYQVGTLFATAFHEAGSPGGTHPTLERALLKSYSDSTAGQEGLNQLIEGNLDTPEGFTLATVADTLLLHTQDPGLQSLLCDALQDRLQISRQDLPNCPGSSAGGNHCPRLP